MESYDLASEGNYGLCCLKSHGIDAKELWIKLRMKCLPICCLMICTAISKEFVPPRLLNVGHFLGAEVIDLVGLDVLCLPFQALPARLHKS